MRHTSPPSQQKQRALHRKLFCYIVVTFVLLALVVVVYVQYLVASTSAHLAPTLFVFPHQRERVLISSSFADDNENDRHQKIENQIHSGRLVVDRSQSEEECGVGWSFDEQENACLRTVNWPRAIDPLLQKTSANPCQNFFGFACGRFNADESNVGKSTVFTYVQEHAQKMMNEIASKLIEDAEVKNSKVAAFYHACVYHNDLQVSATLRQLLTMVDTTVTTHAHLPKVWGALQLYDTILPVELTVELHPLHANQLIPMLKQSGLFDEPDNLDTPAHLADITSRLSLLYSNEEETIKQRAKDIVAIEKLLYASFVDNARVHNIVDYVTQSGDRGGLSIDLLAEEEWWYDPLMNERQFNLTQLLVAAQPTMDSALPWIQSLRQRPLWCYSRTYFERLPDLVYQFPLEAWVAYTQHAILFHFFNGESGPAQLDTNQHYAYHRQYDARYSLPWQQPRRFLSARRFTNEESANTSQLCLALAETYLPVVLDNYYVAQFLPATIREQLNALATIIKKTYVERLKDTHNNLLYLEESEEREQFWRKVESVHVHVGTPERWPVDRSDLRIDPDSYIESILAIRRYHIEKSFRFYLQHTLYNNTLSSFDLMFLDGLVSNANAYYQHQLNTITLNAGLAQPPVFSLLFDATSQYSRFGFLLAHELTHSIDKVGVLFDVDGSYRPWLSPSGYQQFLQRLNCFAAKYSMVTELGNQHDGAKTLNENVADITAFIVAYDAFVDNIEPSSEQRRDFFLSYAQMFCEASTREQEFVNIKEHVHSVNSLRVNNVVMQHEEFASLWSCKQQTHKNKCSIF